jgi:hypothetical protein
MEELGSGFIWPCTTWRQATCSKSASSCANEMSSRALPESRVEPDLLSPLNVTTEINFSVSLCCPTTTAAMHLRRAYKKIK